MPDNLKANHSHTHNLFVYITAFLTILVLSKLGAVEEEAWAYQILTIVAYSLIYYLPVAVFVRLVVMLLKPSKYAQKHPVYNLSNLLFVSLITLIEIVLLGDLWLFVYYGFHINGFVINLVTTPGGIESLGASDSSNRMLIFLVIAIITLNSVLVFLCSKSVEFFPKITKLLKFRYLLSIFALSFISQGLIYGYISFKGSTSYYSLQTVIPGFQAVTYRKILRSFGVEESQQKITKYSGFGTDRNNLYYPQNPLSFDANPKKYNIVWLVAESLRADMLTPEIMPKTFEFSNSSLRFENHYSGGNGTRIGLFSMFYGIYGSYWFDFLQSQRPPVFFDYLQKLDYRFSLYTSARFSYPEFDKTIFSSISELNMHEYNADQGWMSDKKNVDDMLVFLDEQKNNQPFMTFMFFESPHARYYFPDESIIEQDYLEDFNYVTMDLERDIKKIKNRYVNSVHYLDSQFSRIIEKIKSEDLLNNTIIIITGDHGEEFMEKGRWGHNSAFTEEQIRVPLVIHLPEKNPKEITKRTNHIDIIPTLLPLLGVKNDKSDYSLGDSLLNDAASPFMVLSDWDQNVLITNEFKQILSTKLSGLMQREVLTGPDDQVIESVSENEDYQTVLISAMNNSRKFYSPANQDLDINSE